MKQKALSLILCGCLLLSACSTPTAAAPTAGVIATEAAAATPSPEPTAKPTPEPTAIGCDFVYYTKDYPDEKALIEDILTIKKNHGINDKYGRYGIDEFYKPAAPLEGLTEYIVHLDAGTVAFWYSNPYDNASFIWCGEAKPEVLAQLADGARLVEHNSVDYYFKKPDVVRCYFVYWIEDNKFFQAYVPSKYSDEEILAFLQYETIKVEP